MDVRFSWADPEVGTGALDPPPPPPLWFEPHRRHYNVSLAEHFILCLEVVQPRKCPNMTEKLLTGT